ncbi:MAG: hypothetical protein ACRDTD_21260 [Pseudonocardiaceae bacterium]
MPLRGDRIIRYVNAFCPHCHDESPGSSLTKVRRLSGWPFVVLGFAALGIGSYLRARRAGLTRSRCVLRDTRLVLGYLGLVALAAAIGIGSDVTGWLG